MRVLTSLEFEDHLVDGETVAGVGADACDAAVAFGTQHILHLHRLDDGERLAGFHLLALRDPEHPTSMLPIYDCGDHLHPSDLGYNKMGDAIDLSLFE